MRVDPRKDIVLDVSSTSSEESEEEGQQEVRKEKIFGSNHSKGEEQTVSSCVMKNKTKFRTFIHRKF